MKKTLKNVGRIFLGLIALLLAFVLYTFFFSQNKDQERIQ